MIQRRQTLYLLCAVVVLVLVLVLPLGKYLVAGREVVLTALATTGETGGDRMVGSWPLAVLALAAALVPFVTIFLYKRRMLQIRLCFAEFVILLGLQGFVIWYLLLTKKMLSSFGEVLVAYQVTAIFPLVAMSLVWLALRGVMKDEALIRSMNRIR